jgi:1-acyl-sn-glycerol-3-phosphate acyltransferase
MAAFYWLMTNLMALALRIFGRWEVRGRRNVPRSGPLLVVANHLNNSDPPLLGASIPRRLRFMAKVELFQKGLLSLPIRLFGGFPVRRFEADLRALRRAQELLADGEAVALLPEGTRNRHGTGMQRVYPGAALLALRTGAPILPVGITGSQQIRNPSVLLKHPRITVTIGEVFHLTRTGRVNRAAVEAASIEMMQHVAALLPPEYRGIWGELEPPSHGGLKGADAEPAGATEETNRTA